jgi:UDP:flavonoid glycosyltransferase YjiC (YdhE family)
VLPESPGWARRGVHVTGYWYLADPTYQPPAALSAFLAGGAAPVCIGFGSMLHPRAAAIQRSFLSALRDAGQRAIILTGWDGWQAARAAFRDPAFYYLESAPHDWLLPRCKLAIHHGGAGTTAAALQAGVPQWILPFTADQPFWAERIHHIGAAAAPLKPNQVRPETVAARLHAALQDPNLRARAAQLGAAIRAEDGVSRAVEIITQHGAALKR